QVAFTGEYDGNVDVFVVPAAGGVPRRLTWHPGADNVVGWTPDGKQVVFRSSRTSFNFTTRLFTLAIDGTFPSELPFPLAYDGSLSSDGTRIAYMPLAPAFRTWKRYRGGRTTKIWVAQLSDSSIEAIPRENSNDFNPMWVENQVYFLSDRNGPASLFAYDTKTKKVSQALRNNGLDFKSASAGPGAIVYEQFGALHLFDLKTKQARKLDIRVAGDMPELRPRLEKAGNRIAAARLSPKGARAVFEARGEILTAPAEKGDIHNLTNTTGVAERDPAWSPDGNRIAYFSEESGEYALHLRAQNGMGEAQKISLGSPPSFYYTPVWSPDSKKIAYTDKRLNVWYVDIEKA
ncbi:MAG: protease, partial [Gammaproteobacteria bacterium]